MSGTCLSAHLVAWTSHLNVRHPSCPLQDRPCAHCAEETLGAPPSSRQTGMWQNVLLLPLSLSPDFPLMSLLPAFPSRPNPDQPGGESPKPAPHHHRP